MGKKRNKVEIFKLEDRVLFEAGAVVQAAEAAAADQANNDAAGDGSAAAEMQSDNSQTASDELTPDNLAEMPVPPEMAGSDNADDTADADAADFAAADPETETVAFTDAPIAVSETSERILVVLNSSVADADSIVNDLGDNVEVLRLTSGTDALDTINDYLDEHADTKYSAIHLVSHGSEGYITLNGEKIDSTTINPADWKAIGEHLTDDADILVYGCDTAKSEEGKALVQTIANLTGADVAASIDSTGAAGDWDLEYRSGLIEAATINPVSYQHDLAAVTITVTTLDDVEDAADGVTSLREALNQYNTATVPTDFTILFDDSLLTDGKATITLTKALSVKNSTLGSTVSLTIDGDVDGDGTADITLDANKKGRAMTISTPNSTVNLNGLRMINGSVVNGGAISTQGANFYLNVSNSIFEDNWAGNAGGAIANESTGAGIYYTITDTVFRNNTAKNQGGGAISYGSSQVTGGYFIGKGLTFVGNTSTWGGAFWGQVSGEITIRITESLFDSNVATVMGGAIYMNSYWHATPAYAEFVDLTVINNSAEFSGGAIIASNKVDTLIANSTIVGNKLTGNYDLDYQNDNSAQSFGGAGIFVGATNQGDTGGLSSRVTLLHNIIVDNTTFKGETSDIYSGNISNGGQIYSFGNIYGVMSSDATPTTKVAPFNVIAVDGKTYDVTGVTGADLFDLSAVQNAEGKYVADANFQIPLKAISDSTLNDAVNLNDYRLGSYDVNAYKIYCFSVDDGKTWYDYSGTAVTSPMTEYYLTDMVNGARYPYSSAGSTQYAPALMWSENADGTIAGAWNTVDGVIAELSSSTGGEYYFAATDVDYGAASVTVNSNLILRGSADTSGMNLTFVADGGSIRIDGMKFSGSITVATGVDCDITITDALITGGGTISSADLINIVNTTIYDFSGTISATGSMNLVNSTVYGSTGAISGDASAFRILNSIVVDSANVSGYTAKYSVFDLAGSGDTNTYSATAAGIFGTDLNWDGLMLAPVALLPADTNAAMNGAYVAMNGTNLYYSTNKADWFNFDGTAATDDVSSYILALDGAGQKRMVVGGKAVAGAYSSLSEGVSLTVTTAADVVDRYDGYISLREAWLNAYNGTAEYNYDTNGDSAPDGYRITFDANAIRSVTDPVYAIPASPDGTIRIVFGQDDPNYAASFVMNSPAANITIDGADALGNDQKIALDLATGTATRHFHVISGKLTLENLTVRGTGSDAAGNLDLDNARDIIFEKERGGNAIWSIGGTTTIRNVDFERFVFSGVANSWNGILHNRMNGRLIVEDSTFTDNKTDASVLIFSADSSINQSFVTFRNVTIGENNTAATWLIKATGIPVGNFLIENLTVDGATAGAVINTAYQGGYTLNGLTVINSKLGNALSISYNSSALVVDDVLIRDNTFSSHIIDHTITDNVKTVFSNMEIYNNTMTGTNSAVIRFSGNRSSTLFNTVIAGNTGATYGVHLSRQTASLFNNIILGATTDIYAVTAESIGTLNAAGNVYGTALIETGVTLNGVVLTESATGPGADNVVSTQADVFGDQALSTYWDGNTLAIQSDGKAARSGVLVGKIGEVFYYAKNGVWHNADGSVYQVDDGTGTMKDVALTTDAATGYGLGATATVYSTAKNVDTNGNPIDRLYALKEEGSEIFQSGTYAFNYIPVSAEIPALTVSTDQDVENMYDGVISLREALKYAQEDAAALKAGTITVSAFAGNGFDAATGTYTIKFIDTVLQIDLDSTLGTLVLANNALGTYSLTIDGAIASGKVVVDGGMTGTSTADYAGTRIMSIGSGNTVTLQNLTLQKGFVSGGNGGAILNSGSLTLQSVSLLNNANMSDTAITWGGAVYNSGTLVVEDSLFSGNATYKKNSAFAHGAAISNKGTLTISGTTFEGNVSAQDAGAIYNENGKLTITDSKFLNNKAASNGSAIYVLNGSLDVSDSSFSGNTGNNVIYNGGKPVTIDSSVFTGNGGTVLVNYNTGTMYVLNSTFLNNTGNVAIKGQGSANVGSSYTVVLNSTIIGQTGIGVQGYAAGGTVFIGNSIIAGSTQNDIVSQGAPVAVVGSIYDKTSVNAEANANLKDLGGNYVISEHLADGETVYQHLFDTDTPALNSANVLMPTLEKAVSGGIVFRVEPDANSVNMLQYNDGTGWKNVQKYSGVTDGNFVWEDQTAATLLTQAQVAVDQVGNSRLNKATYSIGAVDLQSLIVTTTEDVIDAADGKTSLREAITNAINLGGGTVTFSKNVDWAADTTITVGSTILVNEDLAGDIVIDGSYTYKVTENDVEVAKTGKVNLNASALTERTVILVDTDSTSAASFTFKNMTLTGGADVTEEDGFGQKGAAFWADKLNLTLDGVTVTAYRQLIGSGASNDFGLAGGAVALDNGTLTILNSTLTNNTTTKPGGGWRAGGAVLVGVNGSLVVDQSTFEGNSVVAPNNGGAGGGAIMMEKGVGDATITDSIFKNNSANAYGGAIFVSGPDRTVTISGSQFTGNSAVKGGGALHSGVKLNVSDTVFRQNTAADGGAVVLAAGVSDFSDVRFEQNSATAAGGAIYNKASGSDMTIVNSDFVNNTAVTKGGAIYNNRHFFIDRSSFIGNTVTGTDANGAGTGAGGAIYVFNHSGLGFVTNSTFYNNSATGTGGAIHFEASGNHTVVSLVNVTIAGNHAGVEGGGVYLYLWSGLTNKMAITNSIVLGNTATAEKAFNDWTVLWSTSTVNNGNSSGRLLNSVIGSVKVLGVKGSGIVTDGVQCYNPLYDRNGSSVIGEVYNLSGSADGTTDVTITSSAAYLVNNAKLTNSEYTVAEMVAEVFGSKIMLNRDGRTLRTLNSDLVLGGVKTAVQKFNTVSGGYLISTSFFDGAKWVKVDNGATEGDANINDTAQYQILDVDQNGKSREVTVNGTAYQVRGAMSGLADDTPLVVETLEGGFDAYDGKTSLREAIDYANENGGGTISFSTATDWLGTGSFGSGATITLAPEFGALEIKSNITIESKLDFGTVDQGYVTISGGDATQIFTIAAGAGLTLSNITLTNGFAADTNGGAIYNAGTLTMTNSTVSNSKVVARSSGVGVNGGAIYNASGATLTLTNTDFISNSSVKELDSAGLAKGGAIHNAGTMTITGGVFDGNSAQIDGGAINAGPSATISGVTIKNTLGSNGIYVNNGTVVITDSTFTGNAATDVVKAAGGANVLIEGSLFTGNSIGSVSNSSSTVTIVNCVFVGNTIGGNKGIITTSQGGKTLILNSTVAGNTGAGHGIYAMASSSKVDIYNSVITDRIKILDSTPVNLYSTVYALTDGAGLTADTNSVQVVASDADGSVLMQVFGKDTVSAETGLLPKIDKALTGGIQFKVEGTDLKYHNGTEWLTIQSNTLMTDAQAGSDYNGADRRGAGLYTMGAYDGSGLIVTTNSDNAEDGNTLREAVAFAVANGGGTITFAAGKDWESMGTITLDSTIAVSTDLIGAITIDGSYTKADGSAGRINIVNGYTLNAKGQKVYKDIYLFSVTDTATATASSFTLKNLTFDGLNHTYVAGVVAGTGLTLNVDHVAISNTVVKSTNIFNGNSNSTVGFVYIQSGTLNLTDSVFENNTFTLPQTMSSGVLVTAHKSSTVLMENVKFLDNSMTGTRSLTQAGTMMVYIANASPSVTLRDVEFSGNKALVTDAAKVQTGVSFLDVRTPAVTVERMTAENNTSYNSAFYFASSGTLRDSTFRNNTVTSGSTINTAAYNTGFLKIINTLFDGNSGKNGGAVSGGHLDITDSAFINNTATGNGGALYVSITGASNVRNSTFFGNSAANGGAIYIGSGVSTTAVFTLTNLTITGNTATGHGGGIYALDTSTSNTALSFNVMIGNSIILGNKAGADQHAEDYAFRADNQVPTNKLTAAANSIIGAVAHVGVDGQTSVRNPLVNAYDTSLIVQARNVALNDTLDGYIYSADNILTLDTEHTIDNLITTIFGSRIRLNADGRSVRTFAVEGLTLAGERTAIFHESKSSEFNKAEDATFYVRDTANDTWIVMKNGNLSKNASVTTTTTATSGNVEITKDQYGLDRTFEILWPDANGVPVNTTFTAMGATTTFTIDPLTVTTLDDVMDVTDGKTSLREAIEYANQEGGNQTITFSNATDWLGTGTFGSGAELTLNPALGAMNVTANITIDGALVYGNGIDQGTLTITGGDAIQIFTIAAGGGMTVSNMSLTGGNAGEGNGGAISNAGTLTLNNVNVSNSKAMNGGAIYSTGSLTVNGGTFYGNSVDGSDNLTGNGGAIHSTGTATISSAVFDSNSAKYNGGAIYNSGTLTITGGVFSGHSAQNGVLFNQGNLLISGGTYTGNTANVLGTWGGTALIANAEIFGNTAADTININGDGSVIIIGSTIADNGTNVINAVSGSANVYNSILEGASAGTVNLYSSVYTSTTATADTNSILVTESAEAGSALKQIFGKEELSMSGGMLPVLDKALTGGIQFQVDGFDNLQYHNGTEWITIQANTLLTDAEAGRDITGANRRGAGLYTMGAYDASGLIVTTSADTVDPDDGKNSLREAIAFAVSLGGGTITFSKNVDWTTQGTITLESTLTISGDLAGAITIDGSYTYKDGEETKTGSIVLTKAGTTNYRLFTVTDSNADTSFEFSMRNFAIKNVTLAKHSSATQGAVIYSSKADILLDNLVVDNVKINGSGNTPHGGLFRIESADLTISNSKVSNSNFTAGSGPTYGGVLYVSGGKLIISGSEFVNNKFSTGGNTSDGGVIYTANSTVEISGSTFSGNSIVHTNTNNGYGRGGAAYFDKSTVTINDSQFINNSSLKEGGAIYSNGGTLTVSGSHFEGNISARNGGAIARNAYIKIDSSSFINNRAGSKVSYDTEGKPVYTESGSYSGGAIYLSSVGGFVPITNSTFYGNKATNAGGAIYINAGNHAGMVFSNLTVAGNHANKTAGGIYIAESATNQFHIANSLVLGNTVNTYEVDAEGTSNVTGTTYYDFGFYQNATDGNRHVSASYTVFGVVKHAGATSLTTVRNPLKSVGGVIFGELHNVTLTDNNITSTNGTYSAGTVLYNSNLYADSGIADNKIVDTMVKSVFGSKIGLNADGKTVHTYAVKDLTMNGVLTAYNSGAAMNKNPDYVLVYYDEINQKWVYGSDSNKTATHNPYPAGLLETDQLGNNRKVSLDGGQTYFYVKGATAGLDGNVGSLVVDTLEDVVDPFDFKVSLREAVEYANADGGGSITFSRDVDWSTTDKTITLDGTDAAGNLLGALAVTSDITIDGSLMYGTMDCGTITIDGADAVQLFTIASGVAADFSNMTFANGFVSGKGGAVYNEGTLSLTNTAFRENTAGPIGTNFIGNGGAIYNNGGTLTIADSRFENNLADGAKASHHGGGALYVNNGTVTIRNTIFTGNSGHTGGAIEIEGHTCNVVIHDSVFSKNVSRMWEFWGSGGAINIGSGSATLTVTGSLFDGNRVAGGGNYGINGGAIAIREFANAFIDSSTFVNQSNGVFAVRGTNRTAHMMITNSTIINNSASGGIFFQESSNSFTVINSLIGNNTGLDFFSPGADNGTYSQLHHVITTGTGSTWSGTPATLGGASLTVLSAANFKALFADGSFDADGKVVLTADGTVAISKDGAAAYAGALVGKLNGAYYYAVDGYWYSLDGTKGNALTSDAATGYGLGDTATIYTTAQNTDTNGDPVSRVLTTLAFNIGSHALDTVETPSLVVNAALDAFNPFDGKTTLREAIAEAQRSGGTVTFDQAAIAASGARTVTVGSDTYYVIDILKTANSTNNGSAFILTNNLAIDGGTNKIMLDISKSNGTSMQVGRYFEYAVTATNNQLLTVKNLVVRGSGSDADGNLDLTSNTARTVAGAFAYASKNSRIAIENVTLERFNTTGRGIIDLNAWSNKYEFIDSTIQDNKAGDTLIYLHAANNGSKFSGITVKNNTSGSFYKGIQSTFSAGKNVARNTFTGNTFSSSLINAWQSGKSYTLSATDITNNTMSGLLNDNYANMTMNDVTFTGNTVTGNLFKMSASAKSKLSSKLTVSDTVFSNNVFKGALAQTALNTQSGYDDRISTAAFSNVTFSGNTFSGTGTLFQTAGGQQSFNNLTFYNNTVAGDLFSVNGGTLTLTNSTIAGNTSATAAKIHVVNVLSGTANLLNNILVGNNGTNGTSAVTVADGATVNAFYNVYDSADATLNSTNTVSTMADVLGTAPAFDGKTVAIAPAGAAAINGTLVGKIGSDVYYVADGSWFKVGSDTAAATFDAANTNNDNYGLGTATETSVYTTAQNGMDRLAVADLGFFNVGAYAFDPAMVETASTVVDLAEDVVNPFDGKISLREAIAYAGTGSLGNEITFADAVTAVTLTQLLAIGKNITITDNDVTVNGNLSVASGSTLTVSSGSKVTLGTVSNSGTVDNKGTLTLAALEGAGNLTNSGTLDVNGNFAGGTVNNTGSMSLAGANNSGTGTLGNVTYDGADGQNMIAADTYGNLVISTTGTAAVAGDIKATTTTVNSGATLDVNGDFAGGTLTNNGSLNLAGVNNAATGTLGNVTYDGATQQVIAGTYGDLTISSTGTATANGDLTATTTTVNSGATLDVNGNFAGGTVNNTGSMILAGETNSGTGTLGDVTYDGTANQQIIASETYSDLVISTTGTATVNGNLKAETTTNSATLDVNGNFAGGTVNNTGSMTLSGATNSGTGTLGDVTYDGADQQVIAGTYGNLTINSTGKATATGNISATGDIMNGTETEITGNMTAGKQIVNWTNGNLSVGGSAEAQQLVNYGEMEVSGDVTISSDIIAYARLIAYGSMKVGGDVDVESVVNYDTLEIAGDLTATNDVYNDANLTVGRNFSATITDNCGTLDVNGNFAGGTVNNTGSMTLAGASNSGSGTLGNVTYDGTDQQVIAGTYGNLTINSTGKATATGDISAATVENNANTEVTGNLTTTGDLESAAALKVGGSVDAANITTTGEMEVADNLTASGTVDSDAALTVGGNYSADTTTTSGTLDVDGNFSGGDVTNTGSMSLAGANNTATGTLGDVTYNGTTDQEVIAGTYENLVISTTGNATASDAVTATTTTVNTGAALDADGDLNAGALTNSGNISVAGAFATTSTDLGAVEYDGTAAQNVVEGTYSDLSLTGSDKSLAGAVTVTDSLSADANIDTAGQDLTLSGDVAGSGTISTTTDSGTVTYDGADQNILAGAYNNLALANGTKTLSSANTTTVNDIFTATGTTIQSDAADVLASLTVKDAGNDSTPSSAIAGTTFNGIALNNTGSADGYLYVNADTNNADDATTGVYLVGNVFVAAEGIIYGDTLGEVYITVTNGNGDVISEGTADELGWTWAVGNDAIENATTGTAYELVSKEGFKFRFHGDVDVVIGKRAITVKADDLEIDTGDDPEFTYTYVGELVGSDAFTGELASEGDGSQPGDFEITQGTLTLGDNYDLTFIGGTLTVEGGGQDAHQFPNYNNPGNFAGVYDAPVHSTTHSYDHHESVPTLEHQNDRSIGFLFSVSNKQLGDASGAFGDSAPQGSSVNIHAHTLSDLLKSYDKSEQIIASPANEIEDAKDDMKDLHDFSNNPFGILPDDEDLHTRAYDESIDFTVIGEDNLSTAKAEQFKDEFDAALEELLTLA